ncbi:MAG: transporter substrate-binding domain-containing protein [Lachnospiraceae bacterium]|nr:transporter substrate-binding domain-containing protein [Lachnospiraceae bacterium]
MSGIVEKVKEFVANHKLPVAIGGGGLVFLILILIIVGNVSKNSRNNPVDSGVAGVLRVGIVTGKDQYSSRDGEAYVGIEPKIAQIAADLEEVALEITPYGSVEIGVSAMQSGTIDILMGRISNTDPAVKELAKSSAYGWSGLYFLAPRNDFTDSLSQMGGKQLGILTPVSVSAALIPYVEGMITVPYTDLSLMAQDLLQGKISLGVVGERDALNMVSESLQAQEILDGPLDQYVAVAPDSTIHLAAVNMAIGQYFDELAAQE